MLLGPPPGLVEIDPWRQPVAARQQAVGGQVSAGDDDDDDDDIFNNLPGINNNNNNNNNNNGVVMNNNPNLVIWRERERRQRSIRVMMMFVMMLLLMDDEERAARNRNNVNGRNGGNLRGGNRLGGTASDGSGPLLDAEVYTSRIQQDALIRTTTIKHPRYQALIHANDGQDVDNQIINWAEQRADQQKDEFFASVSGVNDQIDGATSGDANAIGRGNGPEEIDEKSLDHDHDRLVYHYPWNSTGFYRGTWVRSTYSTDQTTQYVKHQASVPSTNSTPPLDAVTLEADIQDILKQRKESIGVFLLPPGKRIQVRDDNNLTSVEWERMTVDASGRTFRPSNSARKIDSAAIAPTTSVSSKPTDMLTRDDGGGKIGVTLSHDSGRAALQIFSRPVPSMKELSLVDGFVKLYDSSSQGYSTRKDLLLRVRGVLIHSIGRLSLVANADVTRSALVVGGESTAVPRAEFSRQRRRLLQSLVEKENGTNNVDRIRDDALALFEGYANEGGQGSLFESPDWSRDKSLTSRRLLESHDVPPWSQFVIPYPFVRDDNEETIRRIRTPGSRRMPPREQLLEGNGANCEFEVNMDVQHVEWTIGAWRSLISRRIKETRSLNPTSQVVDGDTSVIDKDPKTLRSGTRRAKLAARALQDQALVMSMVGTIHSDNCHFHAALNATAIRTDWEATTSKAINYSFYMMLVCLTQILILLRQLLHSQTQSVATRVSLLCIGWQTVVDALVCVGHIYLSLSIQPLFTAFASVAFFKLLIFCLIEMKYMAMIIQARNSSNGGQPTDVLRRQIAMLHLRFYVALFVALLLALNVGDKYRTCFALSLYSFWVPQIVWNIYTEASNPLHKYYIYGMSSSRLVAPLYIFAVRNNFLKEVQPDSITDPTMCQYLVVWIGIQTAVLVAQGKYGARFMIPARFLPPKFDYSRPLPPSMVPPGISDAPKSSAMDDSLRGDSVPTSLPIDSSEKESLLASEISPSTDRHTTAVTTRNRIRGNRQPRNETSMTTEKVEEPPTSPVHTLDCSICYDSIDTRNRRGYMLAPCDHLFHRDCLVQWMDVKMECPICRTELPPL